MASLTGITSTEFIAAVIASIDTWNEQSNAANFYYGGTTTISDLEQFGGPNCLLDFNLIVIDDDLADAEACTNGTFLPKCKSAGAYDHFFIRIPKYMSNLPLEWPFSVGTISTSCSTSYPVPFPTGCPWSNGNAVSQELHPGSPNSFTFCETDLQQVITHELGHALNLAHSDPNLQHSVMLTTRWNSTAQRDLYQYDKRCAREIGGIRVVKGYRSYVSGGSMGADVQVSGSAERAQQFAVALDFVNGSASGFDYVWQSSEKNEFLWDASTLQAIETTNRYSIGPTPAHYRDQSDGDNERVYFVTESDYPTAHDFDSTFRVRYERSSDLFVMNDIGGTLRYCTAMSGSNCNTSTYVDVQSPYPVSVAYDSASDNSVTAWAQHNRQDNSDDRRVYASVGLDSWPRTLPEPTDFGVRSSVAPSVVCSPSGAIDNCLLFYVDVADPTFSVRFKPFHVDGSGNIVFTYGSATYVSVPGLNTSARIASFHHSGYWWVAAKDHSVSQRVNVYRSSNGNTWALYSNSRTSVTGPTSINYYNGTNMVGTNR